MIQFLSGATGEHLHDLPLRPLTGGLALHVAATRRHRGRGLARLGADELPRHRALLLSPCRSVHTLGMRFALDLLWLDRAGAVIRIDRAVGARRVRTCLRARAVVETHAGHADAFAAALRG